MVFEVADFKVASPATVSRLGMVHFNPSIVGLMPYIESWLNNLSGAMDPYKAKVKELFEGLVQVCY